MNPAIKTAEIYEYSKYKGIEPYFQYGRKNKRTTHYYILDNNVLTDLAKLSREEQDSFKELMAYYHDAEFIIPQMVLEESVRNLPAQEMVDKIYLDFYRLMSELEIPIYLETVEDNYQIFAEGYVSKEEAFRQYKEIAQKSVSNIDIQNDLRHAESCEDIKIAYSRSLKDAGERFIFLYAHSMLQDKVNEISILSNEIPGVYNVWKANLRKDELLELLNVTSRDEYCEKVRPVSYNCFLVEFLKGKLTLTLEEVKAFLQITRIKSMFSRSVYYSQASCNYVDIRTDMTNEEFLNFVEKQDDYKLAF